MIDYVLILIISFISVLLGGVLAMIAPEELKAGEKYWKILKWVLLVIILAVIFYFSQTIWTIAIAALLIVLKILKREYPALAFVLLLSYFENFLFLAGSLIFIYGLPEGTIQAKNIISKKIKIKATLVKILKNNILYLVFGLALLPLILAYA